MYLTGCQTLPKLAVFCRFRAGTFCKWLIINILCFPLIFPAGNLLNFLTDIFFCLIFSDLLKNRQDYVGFENRVTDIFFNTFNRKERRVKYSAKGAKNFKELVQSSVSKKQFKIRMWFSFQQPPKTYPIN